MKSYLFLRLAICACMLFGLLSTGCKKDNPAPKPDQNTALDSSHDVNHVLAASQFTLFYRAWKKINFDKMIVFQNNVTVFAPSDSAFTAAGITQGYIDTASGHNLYGLVAYHVIKATLQLHDLQLAFQNYPARTFRFDSTLVVGTGFNLYQQYLYVDAKSTLILNGKNVNKGEQPILASNGLIYSINQVLHAPTRTVYDILRSRPELSLYLYALQLSDDNAYYANANTAITDSTLLKLVTLLPAGVGINTNADYQGGFTVFAPTNAAFSAKGWGTKALVKKHFHEFAQILLHHVIWNVNAYQFGTYRGYYPDRLTYFYNDFSEGGVNVLNDFSKYNNTYDPLGPYSFGGSYFLDYSYSGSRVGIKWHQDSTSAFKYGPAYLDSVNKDFLGTNGVVEEVDKLFYPI